MQVSKCGNEMRVSLSHILFKQEDFEIVFPKCGDKKGGADRRELCDVAKHNYVFAAEAL